MPSSTPTRRSLLALILLACAGCGSAASAPADKDDPAEAPAAPSDKPSRSNEADLSTRRGGRDWPDFLGPNRDGKSAETGILTDWPAGGPPIVWTKRLGTGYGIGTIDRGRMLIFGRHGDRARVTCLHAETGEELWRFEYPTDYEDILQYNNGPRASPVVDGDRVYVAGAGGMLHCLDVRDGAVVWKLDTQKKYGFVQNFFGVGSTPLVEGDLLIVNVGGSPPDSPETYSGRVQGNGSGVVALDKLTGKERYRLTDELASYSSPVAATIGDRRWCFVFARGGLVAFEPASGRLDLTFPWRSSKLESVNASTPLVLGDRVLITECYGEGACLLRVGQGEPEVIWSDENRGRDKALLAHWNTPIHHEGHLYASSGRHTGEAKLRCVRAADGKVMWSEPGLTRASLLYVDGHLVCLGENGVLRLLRATSEKYDVVATAVLEKDGTPLLEPPAWAAPILARGLLYVRGDTRLVCLELIPEADAPPAE